MLDVVLSYDKTSVILIRRNKFLELSSTECKIDLPCACLNLDKLSRSVNVLPSKLHVKLLKDWWKKSF